MLRESFPSGEGTCRVAGACVRPSPVGAAGLWSQMKAPPPATAGLPVAAEPPLALTMAPGSVIPSCVIRAVKREGMYSQKCPPSRMSICLITFAIQAEVRGQPRPVPSAGCAKTDASNGLLSFKGTRREKRSKKGFREIKICLFCMKYFYVEARRRCLDTSKRGERR